MAILLLIITYVLALVLGVAYTKAEKHYAALSKEYHDLCDDCANLRAENLDLTNRCITAERNYRLLSDAVMRSSGSRNEDRPFFQ